MELYTVIMDGHATTLDEQDGVFCYATGRWPVTCFTTRYAAQRQINICIRKRKNNMYLSRCLYSVKKLKVQQ